MPMPKQTALLISCRAMAPFVDVPLLEKDGTGTEQPHHDAPDRPIAAVLKRLESLDDQFDLHTIPSILDSLHRQSWDAGYSLGMGPKQLLDEQQIETINDLAGEIRRRSTKA
jgi:hypothetical protein